jgi:uncharacterized protein YyaL (SSP411 family)
MVALPRVSIDWRPYDLASGAATPILLVISDRVSHAVHVQESESFDDPETVAIIRERYLAVRLDSDDRPDVDARLQALTGRSYPTWPLTCILSPAGEPLAVATHLSRDALLGLLRDPPRTALAPLPPPRSTVDVALQQIEAAFDARFGGFESPPKLPRPPLLDLLLLHAPQLARRTLDAMAQGGIHDQLGGGFHRYSTDERWVVPHFEKRAADQAALIGTYARAAARLGEHRYAAVARRIIAYVECRLSAPDGSFYTAEDADVGPYDDASHYTWTLDEARAALDADELAVAQPYFDLYGRGEMHLDPTRNVLFISASPEEVARELRRDPASVRATLVRVRDKLLQARAERPLPPVDERQFAWVTAKMARAYLEADNEIGVVRERERAIYALERLYAARQADGGIAHRLGEHSARDDARWLADQAELGLAALRAFEATGARHHLEIARATADYLLADFWTSAGGFSSVPGGSERPYRDAVDGSGVGPSGNAVAGELLFGLTLHTGEPRFATRGRELVEALLSLACGAGIDGAGVIYLHAIDAVRQ